MATLPRPNVGVILVLGTLFGCAFFLAEGMTG
jgi:hypothetical protein